MQEESTGGSFDQLPSQRNCQEIAPEKLHPRNCQEIALELGIEKSSEKNGSDDESPDFGPAQEYERVSTKEEEILKDAAKILLSFPVQNNIKFLRMQMTSDMLLRKSSLASFPANLTLCCPAITLTDHHHHHHLNPVLLHIYT